MAGEEVITDRSSIATGLSPELAGLATAFALFAQGSAGVVGEGQDLGDAFAMRVRQWYLEAINHPLWINWSKDADEDMGFYIGGKGQWSKDGDFTDYNRLVEQKRTVVSVNHCQAVVDVMTGYERQNRSDLKAAPQGEEDDESARLMSWFLKYEQDQCQTQDRISETFEDGLITGMDALKTTIEYASDDPSQNRIRQRELNPARDLIWDPYWTEFDGSDARFMLEFRWSFLPDVVAEFPEYKRELEAAASVLDQAFTTQKTSPATTDGGRGDAYGSVRDHVVEDLGVERMFYNPEDQQVLVIEAWHRIFETEHLLFDKVTGEYEKVDSAAAAKTAVEGSAPINVDGDKPLKHVQRKVRRVRMGTVVPATYITLEKDQNPHPNDDQAYPYSLYIAKRKRDTIYGVIRNLKDPQRIENKRWSQVLDILGRFAAIRAVIAKGSVDPKQLTSPDDTSPLVYDSQDGKLAPPGWMTPPLAEITRVLTEVALQMKVNMREVSGVNTDLLGIRGDDASGIAIARRQAQGQVIATLYFDNLRRFRRHVGMRMMKRIQQVYTAKKVMRLTNDYNEPVLVSINPPEWTSKATGLTGDERRKAWETFRQELKDANKPPVLRDLDSLQFDVVLSEAPSSPTARSASQQMLVDLVKTLPGAAPALVGPIIELSDIPNRGKIIGDLRALLGQQPAAPGPGAPSTPARPAVPSPAPPPVVPPVTAA